MSDAVLNDLQRCGPYRLAVNRLEGIKTIAAANGWPLVEIAPGDAATPAEWLQVLARSLGFPAHFGGNFDALYDCLCDREAMPQAACILVLPNVAALGEDGTDTLIAVLQAAADEWRDQGRHLWALFTAPGLDLDPLPQK